MAVGFVMPSHDQSGLGLWDVLGRGAAGEQPQPGEHRAGGQIQQPEQHGWGLCHDHKELLKPQVTACVLDFGVVQDEFFGVLVVLGKSIGDPATRSGCTEPCWP
jgi:hypothetical protein